MRFPSLRPVIMEIIVNILQELRDHTRTLVESIIDSELNYHFTNDLDFKESRNKDDPVQSAPQFDQNGNPVK
jgi:hypothetical protein